METELTKIKTAWKYVYDVIYYLWVKILNSISVILAGNTLKFTLMFYLQHPDIYNWKCRINPKIQSPWSKIRLETKFQPVT